MKRTKSKERPVSNIKDNKRRPKKKTHLKLL